MNFKKTTLALTLLASLSGFAPAHGMQQQAVVQQMIIQQNIVAPNNQSTFLTAAAIGAGEGLAEITTAFCVANLLAKVPGCDNKSLRQWTTALTFGILHTLDIGKKVRSLFYTTEGNEDVRKVAGAITGITVGQTALHYDVDKALSDHTLQGVGIVLTNTWNGVCELANHQLTGLKNAYNWFTTPKTEDVVNAVVTATE